MKTFLLVVFVLNGFSSLSYGLVVTQDKGFVLYSGSWVNITCKMHDFTGSYNMLWYQKIQGKGLVLIAISVAEGQSAVEKDFEDVWLMDRKSNEASILRRKQELTPQDSAVYFCAIGGAGAGKLEFGEGTVLSVIEKGREKKNPNVTIFLPNPQELEQHNRISLVCVASNFYPQQAYIRWKVNGKEREFIDQAKPITVSDTFSVSRRLSLTREEYYNPENIFRCESGFQDVENKVIYKQISGKKGCSSLTDTYRRYTNSGKYSYILILCKSALYGLIVAAVMLRKKMIRSSY